MLPDNTDKIKELPKELEAQIVLRCAPQNFWYIDFSFTGTPSEAIALHKQLAEAFPLKEPPSSTPNPLPATNPKQGCTHEDCVSKVSKKGKRYFSCNTCTAMSFDNGAHWTTPEEMEAYKKSQGG